MKNTLMIIQIVIAIGLSLIILLEPPRGEGLGAIGGSARLFHVGKEKEKRLDKIIAVIGGVFFILAGILAWAL
ncbi:preprotein translocase subunit SecG [bacterium]|nr:preprotein translocase subunit SecG [bacterium]